MKRSPALVAIDRKIARHEKGVRAIERKLRKKTEPHEAVIDRITNRLQHLYNERSRLLAANGGK